MTDELKAMLKAAKTEEEAKEILLANKNELSEEDLAKISGGVGMMNMNMNMCLCAEEEGFIKSLTLIH